MKLFFVVALALLTLVHAVDEWKPKTAVETQEIRAECLKEHPLSEATKQKLKQLEYPDEEPMRQYILCAALKSGIFNTNEGFNVDRVTKQYKLDLDESEVLAIVQGCIDKNEQGSATDVWVYRGHKCLMASKVGDNVRAFIRRKVAEMAKSA